MRRIFYAQKIWAASNCFANPTGWLTCVRHWRPFSANHREPRWALGLGDLGGETITSTPDGLDQAFGIAPQFLAQPRDLAVDGTVIGGPLMAFEKVHDRVPGKDMPGALDQHGQEIEFRRCQAAERAVRLAQLALCQVEPPIIEAV